MVSQTDWLRFFYIKTSAFPTMDNNELELLIADCFEQIAERDESIASYWVTQLFNKQGDIKPHMITERTLKLLEDDVMRVYDYEYEEAWVMTNDDWVSGFQLLMILLLIIGVILLYAYSIQSDHQACIEHGGQWIHGLSTNGDRVYYCIEPAGLWN